MAFVSVQSGIFVIASNADGQMGQLGHMGRFGALFR
jgi:hypothetical protein